MVPRQGHKIVLSNSSLDGDMSADAIRFEVIDDLPSVFADSVKLVSNDGGDVNYVHADHLGAPQKMTDASRSIVWDASFLPFGEEDSLTGSAANDNRFPGQRLEPETGLQYNYFRDYDPTTGRYLQSDPIGLAGGINILKERCEDQFGLPRFYRDEWHIESPVRRTSCFIAAKEMKHSLL